MNPPNPVVDVRDVTLYRGSTMILRGIEWRIERGEHWALIGANGSGKTTLLNVLCGYLWPSSGQVTVLGETFGHTDLRALRKRIGWVSTFLRDLTPAHEKVLRMVLSGRTASLGVPEATPRGEDLDRARELLEGLGCGHRAEHHFRTLSQGEQQRVMIARALMAQPELLILDEVCAGLDLPARESFLATLDNLAADPEGPTIIFVTHHIEEITPSFTHVLLLEGGCVAASGAKSAVLTADRLGPALGVSLEVEEIRGRYWPRVLSQETWATQTAEEPLARPPQGAPSVEPSGQGLV